MAAKDPVARKAYNHRYYVANKARLNAANKAWYEANKEHAVQLATELSNRVRTLPKHRAMAMLRAGRARAKKKNLSFEIDLADVLPSLEWGSCDVTGIPFEMSTACGRHPFTPSIDRIDVSKGYIRGNVRVVVWALNAMRGTWGDEIMLQIAAHVFKRASALRLAGT